MEGNFFLAYGDEECAVGVRLDGSECVASFWTRCRCEELQSQIPLPDSFRDVVAAVQERIFEVLSSQEEVSPSEMSTHKELNGDSSHWRELARRRWSQKDVKTRQKREFYERMQARKSSQSVASSQTCSRCDIAVQCDTTTSRELVDSWIANSFCSCGATIIRNSLFNLQREMPVYSDDMYKISMLIYLTSAKTYKILRQMLQWPSVSSLYRHYSAQISAIKDRLVNIEGITEGLSELRDARDCLVKSGVRVNTQFTLAIDAFSFRGFMGSTMTPLKDTSRSVDATMQSTEASSEGLAERRDVLPEKCCYNNGFLMLVIPHDFRLPVKLLHLAVSSNGAYNKPIDEKAQLIMQKANEMKIRIWFRATDGDPGVSASHTNFYEQHVSGKVSNYSNLIKDVWTWLCADVNAFVPISDPLHIWKNIRSRFITRRIVLFKDSPATDIDAVRKALCLGNALDDDSQIGKMRDNYVMELFTFRNVSKLIRAKQYTSAFLLLPFACWIAVTFAEQIDREFRIFLCELVFQLLVQYLAAFQDIPEERFNGLASDEKEQTAFSRGHYVKRMLNTLCAFGVTLVFGSDALRMDSLGTHLVENAIGIARSTSSDHRCERILATYAHNELRKEFAAHLDLSLRVQGRLNYGGCKIDLDEITRGRIGTLTSKQTERYDQ